MNDLTHLDLLNIDGGCNKCNNAGKTVGKVIKATGVIELANDIYDEVSSWFD